MAGIYIHIPFCKQKCSYCDFHFSTNYKNYRQQMLDCLEMELSLRKTELESEIIESIYFGGGTPSLLKEEEIRSLLKCVYDHYNIDKNCEISFESNPDDFELDQAKIWRELGINRLSIGIQSFDEQDLKWMNRAHTSAQSKEAVKLAQNAGFDNISIDLIYGLPEMDASRWKKQLNFALDLNIQHLSAYCLTIEDKTALSKAVKLKQIIPAESEMQSLHFEILRQTLLAADFIQYEVSNFALKNHFSQHNSNYWRGKKYVGIGPSAHSYDLVSRSWNISNNTLYIQSINQHLIPQEKEILTNKEKFNELLLTGLRTIWGVSLTELEAIHVLPTSFNKTLNFLIQNLQATIIDQRIILSSEGLLFADGIARDLFL